MNNREKFEQDLAALMSRLTIGVEKDVENKLNMLKDWLVNLQRENVVKINHSIMELVFAKYLILIPLAISFIFPIYWMFSSALKDDPQVFTVPPILVPNPMFWENFIEGWNLLPFSVFVFVVGFPFVFQ